MKKKLYIKPMIENVKMLEESSILAASGTFSGSLNDRDGEVIDDM